MRLRDMDRKAGTHGMMNGFVIFGDDDACQAMECTVADLASLPKGERWMSANGASMAWRRENSGWRATPCEI
jgi:hypothetical protein